MGDVDAAIDDLDTAIALAPDDPNYYDSRCELYLKSGQLALGLADCDTAEAMGWTFQPATQALREQAQAQLTRTPTPIAATGTPTL